MLLYIFWQIMLCIKKFVCKHIKRLLDNQYAILFIRGERAVIDKMYDLMKHKHIRQTEDGGAESYIRPVKFLDREPKYDFSTEDLRREYLLEEIEILEQEELC